MSAAEEIHFLSERLIAAGYVADRPLATAMYLAKSIARPLLLEGEPGVGKTEAARAFARATASTFVRLQCYEGIDVTQAVYDWNYGKQLLAIRQAEAEGTAAPPLFGEEYLLRRPLLRALEATSNNPVVLLIDEIDRSDDEFEAFLLEMLQDYAVTIPELGTVRAAAPPVVFLTSNRTRELHDALKRRCLYHWLDAPSTEREREILRLHLPEISDALAKAVTAAAAQLRKFDLRKRPGTAEAIDWARSLHVLGLEALDDAALSATLGSVVKGPDDRAVAWARRAELRT